MARLKHVLVLIILILPMFALAPSLVTSPNANLLSQTKVDNSLPAQFIEETLRVAVYAETNLTLPAYATGGVYTDYYQNVIDLLESAGYAVTALSTQDILDHKLMVADYDAFVLPNQLPRENIINHIKDYWFGGGGILSFEASIGFCFYAGLIHSSLEGQFNLYPIDVGGMWTYSPLPVIGDVYDGINTTMRHPVTKSLEDDTLYPFTGNHTILEGAALPGLLGSTYLNLAYYKTQPTWTSIAGFDNPDRGGKIVFLTGNCSSFETWIEPVIVDAIDWLTPRPKGRILYDLTHEPFYGVDSWDISYVQESITHIDMRGFLVNRSYTFDKLYPPSTLSSENLEGYDILVVCDPNLNFTASEVAAITDWVNAGGSILGIADHTLSRNQNMNYLLSNMDIGLNHTVTGTNALVPSGAHVTHEGCTTMGCLAPGAVGTAGSAFSIWEDAVGVPVIGGDQYGNGRIILIADGAVMRDGRIGFYDNAQALINFVNWLSAATADVLVLLDINPSTQPDYNYYRSELAQALNELGIPFYMTNDYAYLNLSLNAQSWDLVISDSNYHTAVVENEQYLIDHLESGGKLIMRDWQFRNTGHPLWHYLGFESNTTYITTGPLTVYLWDSEHPIFNLPADYGESTINSTNDYFGTDFTYVTLFDNATSIAGITATPEENMSAIVLGANGRAICNMFSISEYNEDTDDSTYADSFELYVNEIGYLYYDRPTIDHPADVTYMETETGNVITWTPTADAGPWHYVFKVNGTSVESGSWTGAQLTFNIDGVNVSITEYELTVFDRLGYSVSDLVVLSVTEYVEPGPSLPFDPTLLLIIGGAAVVIVVILVVFMKKKKE